MEKIFSNVTFMLAFGNHVRAREAASGGDFQREDEARACAATCGERA